MQNSESANSSSLPYRLCVGILLLNEAGRIWLGRRAKDLVGGEAVYRWQMPQGGIDDNEDPKLAALRELHEETGIRSVEVLGQARNWISYDLPREAIGKALGGKYRGQRQKWFAMRFIGDENEINLKPDGQEQEFDAWRWATPEETLSEIVPFKRAAYESVLKEFQHLLAR